MKRQTLIKYNPESIIRLREQFLERMKFEAQGVFLQRIELAVYEQKKAAATNQFAAMNNRPRFIGSMDKSG